MNYRKPILFLALSLSLTACASANTNNTTNQDKNIQTTESKVNEAATIYTSFYPIYNLSKQIAGDKFDVKSFTNLKTESHGWEPSAKDMKELSRSELIFINGAGMEEWQEEVENSIHIDQVDTSRDLELINTSEESIHEHYHDDSNHHDHEHHYEDSDHHHDRDYHHDNGHHEQGHSHHHGIYDPHTWISPVNGKKQAKVIAESLSELDPENEDYYMGNYQRIADELDSIIDEYKEKFDSVDNKNFMVTHKAFSYLARDFGLNQMALTGLMSTGEVNPDVLKEAINQANDAQITTIFYEMGGSDKQAKVLSDEINGKVDSLNTMEFATDEDLRNETSYQELIKANLEALYQSMAK